ncbi:MAG: hypothetical protein NTU53_20355 [Planctomycetota bacterium]|nr:hypothetical protein [Planctomycetota bacterium]
MNDETDRIEAELLGLRPREVSQRLRAGLAAELDGRAPRWVVWRPILGGALAAAAAIVMAVGWWWPRGNDVVKRDTAKDRPVVVSKVRSPPTMWSYARAAGQSAESLDAALARDAARLLRPVRGQAKAYVGYRMPL